MNESGLTDEQVTAMLADRLWSEEFVKANNATDGLLLSLANAWTPEAVDTAIDAAMQAATPPDEAGKS